MNLQSTFLLRVAAAIVLMGASVMPHAAPMREFTTQSFADIRARHAGRPLVVHIWAMSCGPCLAELPRWGELMRKHPDLDLVLVRFDAAPRAASEARLADAGLARVESWAVSSEPDEYLRASIDPRWIGDMPRTLLVAPDGAATAIRGVADLARVRAWLGEMRDASRRVDGRQRTP
ncbi:hypothetical protein WKR88_13910 [Trinickia caryophylli]|uniref:Thioredoxin domain-containing protein n=1 Tax=Trinickia caryophylli TaxID=28094 RepID=A0A1X7GML5_TRICW|nr:hypothetical protein [Trinickia caryophylli]PMS09158.1 TlpA family protein disulfide reductase [Trinickia caryophylli]TRX15003.1 TlpA family protein disulfide reductase [Trinickia caryophylli]WQE14858.1 hypothetical protein U0034_20085 [Trinickia caryophylli]SMF71340.1 hypothetical protein SAMN06295900_116150 [Trinickia caryophylli]GLU35065.1 hypothetical protein Busp01_49070 [Trinickia caryophylli]